MSADSRQQVWDVFAKAIEKFDQKNHDYGDAWRTNGWRGNLSRVFEKVQRVRHLTWRPDPRVPAVGDEQVLDTLQDLLNSTAFAIINLIEEVEYGHEVPRSQRARQYEGEYEPGVAAAFYDQVSEQLPHREPVHNGPSDEPNTTRITLDPKDLPTGPDEQGPAEQRHTPKRGRAVRDNPQA